MLTRVLEAAAMHNFMITTRNGGAKELIKNKGSGLILIVIQLKILLKELSGRWNMNVKDKGQ